MSTTSHEGLVALSSCVLGLSTVAVGMRFYLRKVQKAPLKMDDWLLLPSLLFLAGTTGCAFYGVQHHILGYPTPADTELAEIQAPIASKIYIAFDLLSMATLGCVKLSALFFYHRIFCVLGHRSVFKGLLYGSMVVVFLWTAAFMILAGLQCGTHFSALWTGKSDYKKYCHISYPFLLAFAISDFILDFWILALPIPQILKTKSTWKRKFAVIGVFLLALVGFGACIARLVVYVQVEQSGPGSHNDPRAINTKAIFLSVLEAGLSCIAVNLPSLWSIWNKVVPEDVLRSVRSMISLRSTRSHDSDKSASKGSRKSSVYKQGSKPTSGSSESHLARPDAMEIETHAMYDLEGQKGGSVQKDVHITKTVTQSSKHLAE